MSCRKRVFISRKIPENAYALLAEDCDVQQWDSDEPPSRKDYMQCVEGINGLFCLLSDKIDVELMNAAGPSLQAISTMSVGTDHIDLEECRKRHIPVGYTPGILTGATAELAVALLLATSRRLKEGISAVKSGEWTSWKPTWLCGPGLEDSTVGIVGLGRIGQAILERLRPFGVTKFLYTGRTEKPDTQALGAEFVSFDQLLQNSDFVVVACSFNESTRNLFNKTAFEKMKNSAIFVNISRGGVVSQDDLHDALVSGNIAGAGLDVTTPEPLPTDSNLLKLDNCVVIPHLGSSTYATREKMAIMTAQNLLAGLRGQPLIHQMK